MFIPITVGQGDVSTSFEAALSGTLFADCVIVVNDEHTFQPNEGAVMRRGDTITLKTGTLEDKDVDVVLDDRTFVWHIRIPFGFAAVENGGLYGLVGEYTQLSVGENNLNLTPGEGNNDLFIPDYGNSKLLLVDIETGKFRSHDVDGLIAATISDSRFANTFGDTRTICVVSNPEGNTGSAVVTVYDIEFNVLNETKRTLASTYSAPNRPDIIAATGNGFVVADGEHSSTGRLAIQFVGEIGPATTNTTSGYRSIVQLGNSWAWINDSGTGTIFNGLESTSLSLQTLPNVTSKESIFTGAGNSGIFAIVDTVSGYITVLGATPKKRAYIAAGEVISSVEVVRDGILVGFFDKGIQKYDFDLNLIETVTEEGTSYLINTEEGLIYTRLNDTDIVYTTRQEVVTLPSKQIARNRADVLTFQYSAPVGGPAKLLNFTGEVKVNGYPFEGYLPPEASIEFTMPANAEYNLYRKIGIVGANVYEWDTVNEPRIIMDPITLPPRYEAQVRTYEYETVEIVGITEGYFEEIYTTSDRMRIQVNGGEWVDSALVTLKDTVVIRWYLERFGAEYAPNNLIYYRRNNQLFSSWYVLRMELNGVTVHRDTSEAFSRLDMVSSSRPPTPVKVKHDALPFNFKQVDVTLDHKVSIQPYSGEVGLYGRIGKGYGTSGVFKLCGDGGLHVLSKTDKFCLDWDVSVAANKYSTYGLETEVLPGIDLYQIGMGDAELSSADFKTFLFQSAIVPGGNEKVYVYGTEAGVNVQSTWRESDQGFSVKLTSDGTAFSGSQDMSHSSTFDVVASEYSVWESPNFGTSGVYGKPLRYGKQYDAAIDHCLKLSGDVYKVPVGSDKVHYGIALEYAWDSIERYEYTSFYMFWLKSKDAVSAAQSKHRLFVSTPFYGDTKFFHFVTDVEVRRTTTSNQFVTTASEKRTKISEAFQTYPTERPRNTFKEFLNDVEAFAVAEIVEFDVGAEVGAAADIKEFEVSVVTTTSTKFAERKMEFVVVNRKIRDVEVTDGLFSFEEASDEVDTYGDGTRASVKPAGDSFVVGTDPELDNVECPMDVKLPGKTFGYLGGG